jgi:hypothetical protein
MFCEFLSRLPTARPKFGPVWLHAVQALLQGPRQDKTRQDKARRLLKESGKNGFLNIYYRFGVLKSAIICFYLFRTENVFYAAVPPSSKAPPPLTAKP